MQIQKFKNQFEKKTTIISAQQSIIVLADMLYGNCIISTVGVLISFYFLQEDYFSILSRLDLE